MDNSKNKIMMIIIIALLVVLLGFVTGIGVVMFNLMKNQEGEYAEQNEPQLPGKLTIDQLTMFPLSRPIATNLRRGADSGDHFISVSFTLGINNTEPESLEFIEMIMEKEDPIRDICLGVISEKTYEEMRRPDAREIIVQEILARLQDEFQTTLIARVYTKDWALQ